VSVHSERLEHLEKEVRALRIQVKALMLVNSMLIAKFIANPDFDVVGADAYYWYGLIATAEEEVAEVFDA